MYEELICPDDIECMQQRLPVSLWHDQCRWNRFQCPIPSRFLVAFCNPRIWCCVHTILQQRSAAPCLEYAIHMYLCDRVHLHIVFVLLYSVTLSVSVSIWMVFGFPTSNPDHSARCKSSIVTERAGWKQATTDQPQSEVPELYSFLDGTDERQSVRPLASPRAALLRLGVTSKINGT